MSIRSVVIFLCFCVEHAERSVGRKPELFYSILQAEEEKEEGVVCVPVT